MDLRDLILPSFAQMLDALSGQIEKAETRLDAVGEAGEALLATRLAPDMYPLASQIQFVRTQAEEVRARLVDEVPARIEAPATLADARAGLAGTAERLRAAADEARDVDEARAVELALPNGMVFDFGLAEYVRSWAVPQFYFHLVTAYAIIRHSGVDIGKADYVPHMSAFLRPGEPRADGGGES